MSTLKKIFALTLALAMVMSVAVFADFSDKSTINAKCVEDVNLLSAIGIINGYTDGTFGPEKTITRAEACKMIYVLRNGGDDDGAQSWKGGASFTDVASSSWYAGYVAYCAQYGIVAGRNATTFDPNANVTSLELAKMLLVVAGYRADIQGYTGTEWASNVRKDAESAGLLAAYGAALTAAAPRQWASKMFVNTINAKMAVYYGDMLAVNVANAVTVGDQYLNYRTLTTTVKANENWAIEGNVAQEGTTRFGDTRVSFEKYAVADDLVGKEVVVAYAARKDGRNVIYGVAETGKTISGQITITKSGTNNNLYTVTVGGKNIVSAVNEAKASEVFESVQATKIAKFAGTNAIKETKQENGPTINNLTTALSVLDVKSAEQKAIAYDLEGDGTIDYIVISPVYYAEVSGEPTTSTLTVNGGTEFTSFTTYVAGGETKVKAASGLTGEDLVKITTDYASGEITITKLTEVVVGTLTSKTSDGYVIGGTTYEVYDNGTTNYIAADTAKCLSQLGQSLTLYTDGKYILRAESSKESAATLSGKFAYIIDTWTNETSGHEDVSDPVMVKALLSNGTIATMEYDRKATAPNFLSGTEVKGVTAGKATIAGKVYEYSTTSEGLLRLRVDPKPVAGIDFLKGVTSQYNYDKQTVGSYSIDDSTYAFVKYYETANKVGGEKPAVAYAVIKGTEFKNGMDTHTLQVIAGTDGKDGTMKTASILVYDATAYGTGVLPGMTSTKVAFITSLEAIETFDAESEESKLYIQGIDVETGATETYVVKNTDPTDKILEKKTDKADLRCFFFELEPDEDGYMFTPIVDSTSGWTHAVVTAKSSSAIQLSAEIDLGNVKTNTLYFGDELKDTKVYVRNGNTGVSASSVSAIPYSKGDKSNILIHQDGSEIDMIIYSTSTAYDIFGGFYK